MVKRDCNIEGYRNINLIWGGLGALIAFAPLTGCSGPDPDEMGIIGLNLTFSVAVYSWLIISFLSWLFRKLGRESMVIQKKTLLYQLGAIIGLSVILSGTLFSAFPYEIYPVISKSPLVEWPSLQLYSFMVLPIIAIYILIAYLITLIPALKRYRPYNLTIAVAIHWLFSAHFFLIG